MIFFILFGLTLALTFFLSLQLKIVWKVVAVSGVFISMVRFYMPPKVTVLETKELSSDQQEELEAIIEKYTKTKFSTIGNQSDDQTAGK